MPAPWAVCLLDQGSAVLGHRHLHTTPEALLHAIPPYRQGMVVAVACLCPWYWRADRWADDGSPCVLGHARSRTALHGGTATTDPLDAHQLAARRRGGRLPPAAVSPAQRRAPRALRRRRRPLAPKRAERLAQVHNPNRPYPLPALGKTLAAPAHRAGVAKRCAAPAVPKRIAVDLALRTYDDAGRRDVDRTRVNTATPQDATTLPLRHTVPGIGHLRRHGLRDDLQARARFPRGPDVLSSCRRVTWA